MSLSDPLIPIVLLTALLGVGAVAVVVREVLATRRTGRHRSGR